ncbi:LPXTG cell wall anchor domain-containing protein [Streptococcus loxodontisalivarius]|uniref:LPXTG-motif cell wall-anchored protein n=1 Tax=Streptococcus loxodontisalivarius TaxID=1349415 RepID=A0ABS2PTY5_9STRE|nr:LPXTG-motif cell wall-anchored protein [Streptococcus loxodontisalivarius]
MSESISESVSESISESTSESVSESVNESISETPVTPSHHLSTSAEATTKTAERLPSTGEDDSNLLPLAGAGLLFASLFARRRKKDDNQDDN